MRACAQFLRRAWPGIRHGIALGCLAAFLGSVLFSLVVVGEPFFDVGVRLSGPWRPDYRSWLFLGYIVGLGCVLAFTFAAVPGTLGGAVIGLVLHNEVRGVNALGVPGVLVGGLVGGLAFVPILLVVFEPASISLCQPSLPWESGFYGGPYFPWGIAIAAGAWTGRRLERHEKRRAACETHG